MSKTAQRATGNEQRVASPRPLPIAPGILRIALIAHCSLLIAPFSFAAGYATSTATPWVVQRSTEIVTSTQSVAVTGETITAPAPQPMTARPLPIFVSLTRTPLPEKDLPSSAKALHPEDYAAFAPDTASDALAHEASIQTLPTGDLESTSFLRMRGAAPEENLILVDGRPTNGFALGPSDLSEIPEEQIDHIEILRGGASALYGPNAIGGVINVITKRATYNGIPVSHVSMETGSFGRQTYQLDFGSRLGPVDYFFFGNRAWEGGFRTNSDASTYNIGGNVGISLGDKGKLLFDVATYSNNSGQPGQLPIQTLNARQDVNSQYTRASYIVSLPHETLMTLRLFDSGRESVYTNPDIAADVDRHESSRGGEAQWILPYGLMAGGSFAHDRVDNSDLLASTNTYIRAAEDYAFFAQDTMKAGRFALIPSGRFDHTSTGGDSKNPRVQGLVDATEWLKFSASAARSFRSPTLDEIQSNSALRPERAWTYDAGFEIHPSSFTFRATAFVADVTDLIQTSTVTPFSLYHVPTPAVASNVGTAKRRGVEIEMAHVVNEYFRDSFNYTYLENRGIPFGMTDYVTLAQSPKHTANMILTYTPEKHWRIDSTTRYISSRFSDVNNPSGSSMPDLAIFDARLSYEWRQMELYLGIDNLADRRYEEVSGFPLPGRLLYGGISLRLWG